MNSKLLIPCDTMPREEMFTTAYYIRNLVTEIVSRFGVEWSGVQWSGVEWRDSQVCGGSLLI